jgi:drug/metabolite transporter (DMT)-like permease
MWDYNTPPAPFNSHFAFLSHLSWQNWLPIFWLGLFGSCLVYALDFFVVHQLGAVKMTTIYYIIPVFGTIVGALFLGDWATASPLHIGMQASAVVLIMCGTFLVLRETVPNSESPQLSVDTPLLNPTT